LPLCYFLSLDDDEIALRIKKLKRDNIMIKIEEQEKYAKLILERGLALQPGQSLIIKFEYQQYQFARLVAKMAYRMGARFVEFQMIDLELERVKMDNQDINEYQKIPSYYNTMYSDFEKNNWAYLAIDSTEGGKYLEGSDINKTVAKTKQARKVSKSFHDALNKNKVPWCIVCAPGPNWAKKVLGEDGTEEELWELLKPILKLDKNDPSVEWEKETHNFHSRMEYLNTLKIKSLHYTSDTADLKIGLHEDASWVGGPSELENGTAFYPNLPTYEIFNAPDITKCEGYITTTRPVKVLGDITEKVRFVFENGKVKSFTAEKGADAIQKLISTDAGSKSLGEVALVDENSPISQSGKLFSSILFDENASCHIAIGSCYPECFKNIGNDSVSTKNGNISDVHVDFMVGSSSLQIEATTYDGESVIIMKDGHYTF
jgi:aminopeptidase